jgi:predicted ATPase/transcriptional regulator with XRE-family HTH domain
MTDLTEFGKQLQTLRKAAGLSQEQLVEALDGLGRAGPAEAYRVVDGTLISRWERAHTQSGRQWKPTRAYALYLIQLFARQLDLERAQAWAAQAGYQISALELEPWFALSAATREDTGSAVSSPLPRHNLPTALTSFVGREREIATLIEALTTNRLVTIVGEGGVGKTRLALAAAQAILDSHEPPGSPFAVPFAVTLGAERSLGLGASPPDQSLKHLNFEVGNPTSGVPAGSQTPKFPDGLWFVPLAGLDAHNATGLANQLASAIAKALAFSFHRVTLEPATQLIDFLRPKALLLILDNVEHLTAGTPFALELLQQAPQVRLLITSRVPLNCQAERLLALQGLPVPAADLHRVLEFPSVQLFSQRAHQQAANFTLDAQTAQEVAHLCRLVNGNPLGMELAAHWVQHFTVAEMVAALQQQDRSLLATDQLDVPARHRSMEAVFETSWQLLSPTAQRTLAQLTVFRGLFSREAALAVTGATIGQLVELVNDSLLHTAQESSGRRSYLMHELLRQFAMTKLAALEATDAGVTAAVHRRHSEYYLRFLAERCDALYGRTMHLVVTEVQGVLDNIRAAWHWAVSHGSVDAIDQAWAGLRAFYHVRSLYQEGEEVFRRAAAGLAATRLPASQVLSLPGELQIVQAFFLNLLHRYDEAIGVVRTVLAEHQGQEASPVLVRAQLEWGIALSLQNQHDEASLRLTEAVQRARQLDLPLVEARAHHALARLLIPKGEMAQAMGSLETALRLYQRAGYRLGEGFVLRSLGYGTYHQSQYADALLYWSQALTIYQEVEDQPRVISIWKHLGDAHEALGDLGRAYRDYLAAYTHRDESQDPRHAANTIHGFARLLARLGDYHRARQYSEQALVEQRRLGDHIGVIDTLCTLAWVHQQVGEAATALTYVREALHLSQTAGAAMYEGVALLGLGRAQASLGKLAEAAATYQQALTLQRALGQRQWSLETRSELAHTALLQQRPTEALAWVNEILGEVVSSALQGVREPFRVYWICQQVLQANHDPRAATVLTAAYRHLQTQADTLDDQALRHSFLHQVAVNRAIGEAYLARLPQL